MKILQFPIVRITLWFIIGILFAYYINPTIATGLGFLSISFIAFGISFYLSKSNFSQNPIFAISLYTLFFSIGINTTIIHNESFGKTHYLQSEAFEGTHNIKIRIKEKLKTTANNNRYFAEVFEIDSKKATGKIILNIKKDSTLKEFVAGTGLLINDQLVKNFKPNNPDQFDYGKYLETKGIYAQLFTEKSELKISNHIVKDIWYYTSSFRNTIIENLSKNGFKKEELAIIAALILGQQQDISPEVLRDYQYAGAVHILSVSGLHVGFIMLFITFLLKPIPKNNLGNSARLIIVLISLWLFALVAGLAPSVVRSATMFSFLAIGMFLNRETNMFHTTIVSLFLILLIRPLFLFDIGFQLSYLALFFILWLQPMLKNLWTPRNIILGYFWDILTVSFAAQIGALPLSIYYFHQFPGLFFVTNLVLIPCLSIIMVLGTLMMLLAYFNITPSLLLKSVEVSISLMNKFINWVASIESFVITEIPLSFTLMVLAYLIVFSWIIWFKKPNFTKAIIALTSILVFQIAFIIIQWNTQNKAEFIVFNVTKKSIIAERKGKEIKLFTNDPLTNDNFESKMIQSYATGNFCSITDRRSITNCFTFNHKKILVIDSSSIYKTSVKPEIIILKNSPKVNLERLLATINPTILIADASNYKSYVLAWKTTCLKKKIPFHSTYEKGFYSLNAN